MTIPMSAAEVLEREFLSVRAKLLDIAAVLDRIDRAEGATTNDARLDQIRRSLQVLAAEGADRAEQIQLVFSLPYNDDWQTEYASP